MTEVLLFNIENGKAIKIKNLCRQMYISARVIDESEYGIKLSTLLGRGDDRTEKPHGAIDGEMLYLADFNGGLLNIFLNQLRRHKAAVALKAVMTETNIDFTPYELYHELKTEHETLNGTSETRSK